MENNAILNNTINQPLEFEKVLKATALLYLQEALDLQRYEECAELVEAAKEFGAQQSDIIIVLAQGAKGVGIKGGMTAGYAGNPANRLEAFEI